MKCRVHGVETMGADDGYGLRYIVFLQGCAISCCYCHNVSSWSFTDGEMKEIDDIIEDMAQMKEFYKPNKGGITISGGEPLYQLDACVELARKVHLQGLTVAIDTTGMVNETDERLRKLLRHVDCVLMDLKAGTDELHERLCKGKFERAKHFLSLCNEMGVEVFIRHVVLRHINAEDDYDLKQIINIVKQNDCVTHFDLLPYHPLGEYKWKECGIPYTLSPDNIPSEEDMIRKHKLVKRELPNIEVSH